MIVKFLLGAPAAWVALYMPEVWTGLIVLGVGATACVAAAQSPEIMRRIS